LFYLYIMLKSRKTKKGERGKTKKRRQRGGFNLKDVVSVKGFIIGINEDDTVNVAFYDKSNSKTEIRNVPKSDVTFIRPGKEFTVRPITDDLVLYGAPVTEPQGSRFTVRQLPPDHRL